MMNEFKSTLVYNFEKLGCKGLSEKLSGIFSPIHVRDSDLLSVLTTATSDEIVRIKQERVERLLRQASLFNIYANIDLLEYMSERNIDKTLMDRLCSCAYIDDAVNVIVTGSAGTGKSFIVRALGVQACNDCLLADAFRELGSVLSQQGA